MKGATRCAQRLKTLFSSLRSKLGKVGPPPAEDPVTQMLLGILSRDMPESRAREALDRLRSLVVDYNELRVIPPIELAGMIGDGPDVRRKCEDISRSLNRVFALAHAVSLQHLANMSPQEVRAYLNRIDGLEAYTRARIILLGLRQHAIPLDEAMWAYARQQGIVDAKCSLEEAQGFLERRIAPECALEFFTLLRKQAWHEMGAAVRRGEVQRILSVPPDRTSRNMLQLVDAATDTPEEALPPELAMPLDLDNPDESEPEPATVRKGAAPRSAKKAARSSAAGDGVPAGKSTGAAAERRGKRGGAGGGRKSKQAQATGHGRAGRAKRKTKVRSA